MSKAIIGVHSNNPITTEIQGDHAIMDQIQLPNISGTFEVRDIVKKGNKNTYHLMPV